MGKNMTANIISTRDRLPKPYGPQVPFFDIRVDRWRAGTVDEKGNWDSEMKGKFNIDPRRVTHWIDVVDPTR